MSSLQIIFDKLSKSRYNINSATVTLVTTEHILSPTSTINIDVANEYLLLKYRPSEMKCEVDVGDFMMMTVLSW